MRFTTRFFTGTFLLLVAVFVVACAPAAVEPDGDDLVGAELGSAVEEATEAVAEATSTAVVDSAESAPTDPAISTVDDRPSTLRNLTRGWNTNWERHTIDYADILSGGPPRDGIPSIDDPIFISQDEAVDWLADVEPVVALDINGDARAYPLQVLTWHEIANDTIGGVPVIVTFCPLCNSALVFERTLDGEPVEFGVSGLLRNSDLIMYDRKTESLWQQFTGEGVVGDKAGEQLTFVPSSLISFGAFREIHPDGRVLSRDTGFNRDYGRNPYVGYDDLNNNPFLYNGPIDSRLPAMARVATVAVGDTFVAYPYAVLQEARVINDAQDGQALVVFFEPGTASALGASVIANAEDVGATGVFSRDLDGQTLTFSYDGLNIVDDQTNSVWNIRGLAESGQLAGQRLTQLTSADHFWFSWAAFRPDTIIYVP